MSRARPPAECLFCGTRREVASACRLCRACRVEYAPTAVDLVLGALGMSIGEAAELAGVCRRTVSRAAAGVPLGADAAARVGRALRIDPGVLIAGTQPPKEGRSR